MAIKISGTTIINDSRAILDHTSNVGTAGSMLVSTGAGICWKDAPSGFSEDAQGNLYAGTTAGEDSDADTYYNIGIGYSALHSNAAGDKNIALGWCAGANVKQGGCNVFLGAYAGVGTDGQTTGGIENIAIGLFAGKCLGDDSYFNIIIGKSGHTMTNGHRNILVGHFAGAYGYPNGNRNVVMGEYAGRNLGAGSCNIILGPSAGCNFSTGDDNIIMGRLAMGSAAVTGSYNIVFGANSGKNITSGHSNVFIGKCAGQCATNAPSNVVLGQGAVSAATFEGDENVVAGFFAGCNMTSGNYNVLLGSVAGRNVAGGSRNFLGGYAAGDNITSGSCNVIIGSGVDAASATGDTQMAVGAGSTNWISGDDFFNITTRSITPESNNNYNLGTTSTRWANIYTNDLQLSNKGSVNDIDGTWGDFTVQEGENDLFLINNRSGKKYKFNLTEVA